MADIEQVIEQLNQLKHCLTKKCDITCQYYQEDILSPCKYDVSCDVAIDEAIQTIRELQEQIPNTDNKKDKDDFVIHIMNGYDTLQSPNGDTCFGCYINGEQEAYVAGNIPTDQLFHTIAHEYMHYLQDIEGRNSDEKEANDFGFSVFTPAYQQGIVDGIDECIKLFKEMQPRMATNVYEFGERLKTLKEQNNE